MVHIQHTIFENLQVCSAFTCYEQSVCLSR